MPLREKLQVIEKQMAAVTAERKKHLEELFDMK